MSSDRARIWISRVCLGCPKQNHGLPAQKSALADDNHILLLADSLALSFGGFSPGIREVNPAKTSALFAETISSSCGGDYKVVSRRRLFESSTN